MHKSEKETKKIIEDLVQKRELKAAKKAISTYLKREKDQVSAKIQASEWLRRLGLFKNALKVLGELDFDMRSVSPESDKLKVAAAHILNMLGANDFALTLIENVELRKTEDLGLAGKIYLNDFNFKKAENFFSRMVDSDHDPESYRSRLDKISLADALMGLNKFKEAFAIVKEIEGNSSEPLIKGICLQARGEYLAQVGEFEQAEDCLKLAQNYFPSRGKYCRFCLSFQMASFCRREIGRSLSRKEALLQS